jgi:hypothetical protein
MREQRGDQGRKVGTALGTLKFKQGLVGEGPEILMFYHSDTHVYQ